MRIRQPLPVLGSDIAEGVLYCRVKGAEARGQRTPDGFVVFQGSTAVAKERPSAENYPWILKLRRKLIAEGTLVTRAGHLAFTKDAEFTSPSAAAVVVHGGPMNGLTVWKARDGQTLKQIDEQA